MGLRATLAVLVVSLAGGWLSFASAGETLEGRVLVVAGKPACRDVNVRRARFASRFFPRSQRGAWGSGSCLYLLEPGRGRARVIGPLSADERVRGLTWAPDGGSFAVTVKPLRAGWRVDVFGADGRLRASHAARSAAFLRDGRLVVERRDGLYLVGNEPAKRFVSVSDLKRQAGFPAGSARLGEGTRSNGGGWGVGWVAVRWYNGSLKRDVLLVVSATGEVKRASPVYGPNSSRGFSLGGVVWSPDGRELFQMPATPWYGTGFGGHDHCLDSWTLRRGFRRLWCISSLSKRYQFHFDRLAWATQGQDGLLDNGTLVTRRGRVSGRLAGYKVGPGGGSYSRGFSIHWTRG